VKSNIIQRFLQKISDGGFLRLPQPGQPNDSAPATDAGVESTPDHGGRQCGFRRDHAGVGSAARRPFVVRAARALVVFIPIHWAWVGITMHANLHEVDRTRTRLGVFAGGLCGGAATAVSGSTRSAPPRSSPGRYPTRTSVIRGVAKSGVEFADVVELQDDADGQRPSAFTSATPCARFVRT
jgi:hypothetical protein